MHPRLTSLDGASSAFLAEIGPWGSWGDLSWITRYGDGPCGMFEASWSMPLPPDFDHPLLRRGTRVELMDGPWRVGSTLVLNEPARGGGYSEPWRLVASGVAREAIGENSYYAVDGSWNSTGDVAVATDRAIADGLPWAGRDANTVVTAAAIPDGLISLGTLFTQIGDRDNKRWGVGQDDYVRFLTDPTEPTYHVVPDASALAVADDNYATLVIARYVDSTSHTFATVTAPASAPAIESRYGHREYAVDLTDRGEISAASAQARADGIYALTKGRLGWANGLTLNSNQLLTPGGVPADLSLISEQVGEGLMIRLHGLYDDLLETPYLDVIIGEAKYADGSDVIDLAPLGMVATDFAAVIEQVAGPPVRV